MHDNDDIVEAWRALAPRVRQRRDAEAEDYLQEAVVAALDERRRTGRAPAAAAAWLRTVARRREVDHVRRAQCERRVAPATFADETDDDVAHRVAERHEARWLAGHVELLPPTTRNVVRALAEGRSQLDVADELDLTPRAVEAHVRRARMALRRVQERAGAVLVLLLGGRRWRKTLPLTAAGVATAVGVAMMGTPDTHILLPLPPKPRVEQTPDPDLPRGGIALAPRGGTRVHQGPTALRRNDSRVEERSRPEPTPAPTETTPPPTQSPVGTDFALVNANGREQATNYATEPGVRYLITVAGTYSYNGRNSLADCGHWQPETDGGAWKSYEALLMDDVPAPCSRMPFDPTHVYKWEVVGTGRPIVFRVRDFGGGDDNIGHLLITMSRLS